MLAPNIDPVLVALGPIQIRWYGLMYVIGFLIAGFLLKILVKEGFFRVAKEKVDAIITYALVFMFVGARLAYVFIYNWDYYQDNLSELFSVWKGGLSFHGAIMGMAFGVFLFARKNKIPFLQATDAAVISGTQGVFFGRMGNFINHELWGRVTDVPWGMVFTNAGPYPRHPSQLYEGITEGIILFAILWFSRKRFTIYGQATAVFFFVYAIFRFVVEFFREPDSQLGYYLGGMLTMGQILCILQMFLGVAVFLYAKKKAATLTIVRASS
ncbi:MAG: prolipoprotein diacylglyceryl transferase [Bdellovibrionales bacterium GWA2_49_15]|nr:MAG: prolipoprotein diacylglyceryl transferase [Bdellovibrionales bacterium GWA2_49_15]HAZ11933.1 prolipoprotein diacylglyceryl transferase [Bdellovibrionales bacterium]